MPHALCETQGRLHTGLADRKVLSCAWWERVYIGTYIATMSPRMSSQWGDPHVFGLFARFTMPLAIMPSADQVPVKSTHSKMPWPMWIESLRGETPCDGVV